MLVLSRKPMERVQIGESVVVTILQIRGNRVRVGIDAPKGIPVVRSELQDGNAVPTDFVPAVRPILSQDRRVIKARESLDGVG